MLEHTMVQEIEQAFQADRSPSSYFPIFFEGKKQELGIKSAADINELMHEMRAALDLRGLTGLELQVITKGDDMKLKVSLRKNKRVQFSPLSPL